MLSLKNKCIGIIYSGCLRKEPLRKIHKELYDATINVGKIGKYVLATMLKESNRARKISAKDNEALILALLASFKKASDKAKKAINHQVGVEAEREKEAIVSKIIKDNRKKGRWFYLASSHNDCAKDHLDYQGRLYVDDKAPQDVIKYAKQRGLLTLQWVMDGPVWFVTRPNCRHYFVALRKDDVAGKKVKDLKRKYHTHSKEGDRSFATPARIAVEEYEDRLKMLRELQRRSPNPHLKAEILKTELLLKKWKKAI